MNILSSTFLGLLLVILLVVSSYGAPINESETNITTTATNFTYAPITLTTPFTTPNANLTTKPITTAPVISNFTTAYSSPAITTGVTSMVTSSLTNATTAPLTITTTTKQVTTTTKGPGRKFDGLSFIGGMILAAGLAAIIFLVISYVRRNNQLPYSNLR